MHIKTLLVLTGAFAKRCAEDLEYMLVSGHCFAPALSHACLSSVAESLTGGLRMQTHFCLSVWPKWRLSLAANHPSEMQMAT